MPRFTVLALSILSMMGSSQLYAQDLMGSVGSATRSYSYVEFQYLPEVADDTDGLPILLNLVMAVTDEISITGEYQKLSASASGADFSVGVDGESLSVGVLYHQPLAAIADSDWVAGLSVGRNEFKLRVAAEGESASASVSNSFQVGYVGIRRSFTDKIEGEAGISLTRTSSDTNFAGELRGVYRLRESIDIAVALNDIGETDLFGIGLRYTW